MWEKLKNDKYTKSLLTKLIIVLVVASAALLLFDVLTQSNDGRRQIVDENGGSEFASTDTAAQATREEAKLKEILSGIKGVGDVDVMITYNNGQSVFTQDQQRSTSNVGGVIITAEGAGNVVVEDRIISAVTAVFNIPSGNVMVFEKEK